MTSSSQAWKRPKSPSAGARSLISHLQPGQKIVPGYFASAYALGRKCLDWLKRQPGSALKGQIISASLGLVLLGLAIVIPVAGALVNAFAVAFGLGALLLTFAARRRGA